jgi:acetyl-CoA carboxylase biotin carboxylase subunit
MKARKIERLAIANRGEVAVRIIRACQELGIETILLHSEPDVETLAYRLADRCVLIGPAEASKSYLDIHKNITAALSAEADAIHPGFGFLSENADFAEACEKARIIFVGPSAESIRLFGNKISAKNLVKRVGAPIIPGYDGEDQSDHKLISEIEAIGLPVMVKAAGGGGGRGLRVVRTLESAKETIASARREAQAAFGNDKVFLEKYLEHAKHIEFQIFGDASGRIFNLSERECSVQRRHQKIVEEAPAAKLDPNLRRRMAMVANEIAETAKYAGAGTVEFLIQDGDFYFMEMNTRLQVEHPVTEMVLGIDLVKAQILSAQGQGLLWAQDELVPRGHAIECRLYAEDPYRGGMPSTGRIHFLSFPQGAGRRFECGLEEGDEVTSFYDPMIAKVIVWDESRPRAIRKMIETLRDTVVFGVHTNIPYLIKILQHSDFVEGKMTTQFIDKYLKNGVGIQEISNDITEMAKSLSVYLVSDSKEAPKTNDSPWLIRK